MKTDDLITALAADLPPASAGALDRRVALFLIPAALIAFVGVWFLMGINHNLPRMAVTPVYWAKAGYTLMIAGAGFWLLDRAGRPGTSIRAPLLMLGVVLAIVFSLAIGQTMMAPADERMLMLMGHSSDVCTTNILILSAMASPFIFFAARRFAPVRPALAGAAAGLLTSGLAATLYGLSCNERTAAFLAVWYVLGMGLSALVGALIGKFAFRW